MAERRTDDHLPTPTADERGAGEAARTVDEAAGRGSLPPSDEIGYGEDAERPHAGGPARGTTGAGSTAGGPGNAGGAEIDTTPTGTGARTTDAGADSRLEEMPEGASTPSTANDQTAGGPAPGEPEPGR